MAFVRSGVNTVRNTLSFQPLSRLILISQCTARISTPISFSPLTRPPHHPSPFPSPFPSRPPYHPSPFPSRTQEKLNELYGDKLKISILEVNLKLTEGRLKDVEARLKEAEEKNRMRMVKMVLLILLESVVNETGKLIFVKDDIRREAQTMSLIDHPNVVRAYCSFVVERNLWVVLPFMAEGSCLHLMKIAFQDGFEEAAIGSILKEALKALEYLRRQGHIHRDVKAGNILLDTNGVIKLADFGVSACVFDTGERQRSRNTFVGTPCW